MFDRESEAFLRSAPALEGFNPEFLPERFTGDYARLVAARVRGEGSAPLSAEDEWTLAGIADVYELIATTSSESREREPAAFVAATAQQLLAQASRLDPGESPSVSLVTRDAISPEVAAPLLFLIAKQFADATDAAMRIAPPAFAADPFGHQLLRAVRLLAQGRLAQVVGVPAADAELSPELNRRSTETLQQALLRAIKSIASTLLGETGDPRALINQIIEVCDGPTLQSGQVISSFPGHQQTARLLGLAYDALDESALVRLPTPPRVDEGYWRAWVRHRAATAPFTWPNHGEAVRGGFHHPGTSAVLVLPTGAGKTTLASMKIASALGQGSRVVVLAPTHALVEQLTGDLARTFPELEGTRYPDAGHSSISVMTPEHCLALLSFQPTGFDDVSLIVFDEAHLLSMESGTRRSIDAMLAILLLTRRVPDADLLLLSAMLRNGSQVAEWVTEITGRPCLFFEPLWKPSRQARGVVMYRNSELTEALKFANQAQAAENRRTGSRAASVRSVARSHLRLTPFGLFGLENNWLNETTADVTIQQLTQGQIDMDGKLRGGIVELAPSVNRVATAVARAAALSGLKSIVFANVKSHTISMARDLRALLATNAVISEGDQELWDDLATELGGLEHALNAPSDVAVCHNGLMLRVERVLAERSFQRRDGARVIVATPTLAQGMNLPADIAILASEKRAGIQRGREPLASHELMNAAARAGRAGHVANGLVVLISETVLTFEAESPLNRLVIDRLKAILPNDDRSVDLLDPLQSILDRLSSGMTEDPDVEYLLNRLRLENDANSPLSIGLADRSLAGFQARRAGIQGAFNEQVQRMRALLEQRSEESPLEDALRVVAAQTGLSGEMLVGLRNDLADMAEWPDSIAAWVSWTLSWLGSSARTRRQMFGTETGAISQSVGESIAHDLTAFDLTRLEAGVHAWISGSPLNAIEQALGTDAQGSNRACIRARNLVTKAVPLSVTFAVSVVALVAKGIERQLTANAELVLDCLVSGVREGFDSPALIAFAQVKGQRSLRVSKHLDFARHLGLGALEDEVTRLEDLVPLVRDYLAQHE